MEHQARVLVEIEELSEKVDKLSEFIDNGDAVKKINAEDANLLVHQLYYMRQYLQILNQRKKLF